MKTKPLNPTQELRYYMFFSSLVIIVKYCVRNDNALDDDASDDGDDL